MAQIKPLFHSLSEKQGDAKAQAGLLDQISQLLNREKKEDEKEEKEEMEAEKALNDTSEKNESEKPETEEEADVSLESLKTPVSSAEAAFDAFKAFFTPKPLKKDPVEKVDLEAVRKKIRTEKDVLRALFERTSSRTPEKKDSSNSV